MSSTTGEKVNSGLPERPYFVNRQWRKYMALGGRPAKRGQRFKTKFEALVILWNEYSHAFDVRRYAEEFNWHEADVRVFINELERDGVFDEHKPSKTEA